MSEDRSDRRFAIGAAIAVIGTVLGVMAYGYLVPRLGTAEEARAVLPLAGGALLVYEYDPGSDGPDGGSPSFERLVVIDVHTGAERAQRVVADSPLHLGRERAWIWSRGDGLELFAVPSLEPLAVPARLRAGFTDERPCVDDGGGAARLVSKQGEHVWFALADGSSATGGSCSGSFLAPKGRGGSSDSLTLTSGAVLAWERAEGGERLRLVRRDGPAPVAVPNAPTLLAPRFVGGDDGLASIGDDVFVAHRGALEENADQMVTRLSATGGVRWTTPIPLRESVEIAVLSEGVLVLASSGSVGLDAGTGAWLWQR